MARQPSNTTILVAVTRLEEQLKSMQEDFAEVKPVIEDYKKMKNRGMGLWFAVTLFFTALGGVLTNRLEKMFN